MLKTFKNIRCVLNSKNCFSVKYVGSKYSPRSLSESKNQREYTFQNFCPLSMNIFNADAVEERKTINREIEKNDFTI